MFANMVYSVQKKMTVLISTKQHTVGTIISSDDYNVAVLHNVPTHRCTEV